MSLRVVAFLALMAANHAFGSNLGLRLGPPSFGTGGPNPISFQAFDAQLSYTFDNMIDTSLSITGLFVGHRSVFPSGAYMSLGGGVALSANGAGPAIYSAFGADIWCGWICFSSEYLQAVGFYKNIVISPYALRLGVSTWFK
jgi:hypothetical protein